MMMMTAAAAAADDDVSFLFVRFRERHTHTSFVPHTKQTIHLLTYIQNLLSFSSSIFVSLNSAIQLKENNHAVISMLQRTFACRLRMTLRIKPIKL